MSTTKSFNAPIPFCFKSREAAKAAEERINNRFDFGGLTAYATERIVYVPTQKAFTLRSLVEDYVKTLGGRPHTD